MSHPLIAEHDYRYIQRIKDIPMLSHEEEQHLTKQWKDHQNQKAADELISAHLRLVAKIASGYRGYGLPLSDLIAEGNIGIMQAMRHFDPEKGVRFSSYATWWIKSSIQEYILHSWSMVKIGTTSTQKKLFFNLRRTREIIREAHNTDDHMNFDVLKAIAEKLNVPVSEVEHMTQRLIKDSSLNTHVSDGTETTEWIEWLVDESNNQEIIAIQNDELLKRQKLLEQAYRCLTPRETEVIKARRLKEPADTLEDLSIRYGISKERVRQLENNAFLKLKKELIKLTTVHPNHL